LRTLPALACHSADPPYHAQASVFPVLLQPVTRITGLLREDVRFDDKAVVFRDTKSHQDRSVPIAESSGLLNNLRRLQAATILDGGPFVASANHCNTARKRAVILNDALIPNITIHDLRRTGITRALLAGVPHIRIQKLAGHRNITTTMRYYAEVNN